MSFTNFDTCTFRLQLQHDVFRDYIERAGIVLLLITSMRERCLLVSLLVYVFNISILLSS